MPNLPDLWSMAYTVWHGKIRNFGFGCWWSWSTWTVSKWVGQMPNRQTPKGRGPNRPGLLDLDFSNFQLKASFVYFVSWSIVQRIQKLHYNVIQNVGLARKVIMNTSVSLTLLHRHQCMSFTLLGRDQLDNSKCSLPRDCSSSSIFETLRVVN
jgi:hypothetical protein